MNFPQRLHVFSPKLIKFLVIFKNFLNCSVCLFLGAHTETNCSISQRPVSHSHCHSFLLLLIFCSCFIHFFDCCLSHFRPSSRSMSTPTDIFCHSCSKWFADIAQLESHISRSLLCDGDASFDDNHNHHSLD